MSAPRTPADVPDTVNLAALADELTAHTTALIDHRHGITPLTDERRTEHAVAALALSAALADRLRGGRWVHAREALSAGAGVQRVATAMALDPSELRIGLAEWADGQRRFGLITDAEHAEILALMRT